MTSYLGITDFRSGNEVEDMLEVFNQHKKPDSDRRLMVGVMMSYKTLHGISSQFTNAFPSNREIADIFCSDQAYNCLHYADYQQPAEIVDSLSKAISYGGIGIHAVQLDMIWPEPNAVAKALHISRKSLDVILQINRVALDVVDGNPMELVEALEEYREILSGVLLDMSAGRGIPLEQSFLRPLVETIATHWPDLGIGIAGGLGPNTLHLVKDLLADFPQLSIDAQGKLRPSGSNLDPIDWKMAAQYVAEYAPILS